MAIWSGKNQIPIAAYSASIVKVLMFIWWPLSYPISIVLDKLLGMHHKTRFQNSDLKALIELHSY